MLANPNTYMSSLAATQANLPTTSKLLVSNLPMDFSEDHIYQFLRTFGKIKFLEMIKDPLTKEFTVSTNLK